jgi:hypothetical protein
MNPSSKNNLITIQMRNFLVLLLIFASVCALSQEYNPYLVSKIKYKDKGTWKQFNGQLLFTTNEKVAGGFSASSNTMYPRYLGTFQSDYSNPKIVNKAEFVDVLIRSLDYTQAGLDTTGIGNLLFCNYNGIEVSTGYLNWTGKFIIPPLYTNITEVSSQGRWDHDVQHYFLGQRMKSGTWRLSVANPPDFRVDFIGESKDFRVLTADLVAWKSWNGRWGLIDSRGQILSEAIYDTIEYDLKACGTRSVVNNRSCENMLKVKWCSNTIYTSANETICGILKLKTGDSVACCSGREISMNFKNPSVSLHALYRFNKKYDKFIYITDSSGRYALLGRDGSTLDMKYKYAYLEEVRLSAKAIGTGNYIMTEGVDYSKPFGRIDHDSIRRVKQQAHDNFIASIENSPGNFTKLLKGSYQITSFMASSLQINTNMEMLSINTLDFNTISLYISVKQSTDIFHEASYYSFSLQIACAVSQTGSVIHINSTPKNPLNASAFVTGTFTPSTGELTLEGKFSTKEEAAGTFILAGKKDP